MKPWIERPRVEATLLNPALTAVLLSVAAREHEARAERAMVWPLAFLVPPLVLHGPTREALPKTTAAHLPAWIGRNPLIRAGFPQRAAQMTPLTREGLRLGLRSEVLTIEEGRLRGTIAVPKQGAELRNLMKAAALLGRWLTKLEEPSTAFALLGVRP